MAPKSLVEAGEALDLAYRQKSAAEEVVASLEASYAGKKGFELRVGSLVVESPRRRRWRKANEALQTAGSAWSVAMDEYRSIAYAGFEKERAMKRARAEQASLNTEQAN